MSLRTRIYISLAIGMAVLVIRLLPLARFGNDTAWPHCYAQQLLAGGDPYGPACRYIDPATGQAFPANPLTTAVVLLPLVAPFSDVDVATGIVKSVTLSLTEEKGRNRTQPHLDLFFPRQVGEGLSMADLAAKYLALDTSAGSSADATLLGATAIRQQGTSWDGSVRLVGVGYLTVIGGQTVVLFGRGPDEKMTEDIIAAVDKAAAGLMRFVPEEGEE